MPAKPATVADYLAQLPEDRRAAINALRKVFRDNLDPAIEEGIQYGMIGYFIPHRVYPAGYHCDPAQPLPYAGIASQKNHLSLYMMCTYGDDAALQRFHAAWARTGKRLDMGKSCIRFKRIEDLALDVIAQALRDATAARFIAHYEANVRPAGAKPRPTKSAAANPAAVKKSAAAKPARSRTRAAAKTARSPRKTAPRKAGRD